MLFLPRKSIGHSHVGKQASSVALSVHVHVRYCFIWQTRQVTTFYGWNSIAILTHAWTHDQVGQLTSSTSTAPYSVKVFCVGKHIYSCSVIAWCMVHDDSILSSVVGE